MGLLTDYEVINVIGTGSYGTCYKVQHKVSSKLFVWKAIDYGDMSEDKKQLLVSEANLLSELKHPNIVRYYDRIIHKETKTLFIIMECCEQGDLSQLILKCKQSNSYIEEQFVWRVLYQIAKALQACHSFKSKITVLHRDIKPANVFLDSEGNIKLGDFGLARAIHSSSFADTIVGTPNYMSPEIIKGSKYNRQSDIWSLGCLIYELCALIPPFFGLNFDKLSEKIKEGKFKRIPESYSTDLHKIITFMLSVDVSFRPTVEVILHHPIVIANFTPTSKLPVLIPHSNKSKKSLFNNELEDIKSFDLQINYEALQESCSMTAKSNKPISKSDTESIIAIEAPTMLSKAIAKANSDLELSKDPQEISTDTFKQAWLSKLETIRQRESALNAREEKLMQRERSLVNKEKQIALMDRLAKEKMARANVYLKNCRSNNGSGPNRVRKQKQFDYLDLDSSFSAYPGDESILPTTTNRHPRAQVIEEYNRKEHFNQNQDLKRIKVKNRNMNPSSIKQIEKDSQMLPDSNLEQLNKNVLFAPPGSVNVETEFSKQKSTTNISKSKTEAEKKKKSGFLSLFSSNKGNSSQASTSSTQSKCSAESSANTKSLDSDTSKQFTSAIQYTSSIKEPTVWNADNKKAAFEMLAILNASNKENEFTKPEKLLKRDLKRKSMIIKNSIY